MAENFFIKSVLREKHNYFLQELRLGNTMGTLQFLEKENSKSANRELVEVKEG